MSDTSDDRIAVIVSAPGRALILPGTIERVRGEDEGHDAVRVNVSVAVYRALCEALRGSMSEKHTPEVSALLAELRRVSNVAGDAVGTDPSLRSSACVDVLAEWSKSLLALRKSQSANESELRHANAALIARAPELLAEVEALRKRVEELESRLQGRHNPGCDEALREAQERAEEAEKRVEELEGEARVLIGCPCLCHTGEYGEPHRDCRECVRGCTTPSAIDHDHEWALWFEKWTAALDTTQNWIERYGDADNRAAAAQERAEKAEAERDKLRNESNVWQARALSAEGLLDLQVHRLACRADKLQADLDKEMEATRFLTERTRQLGADLDAALDLIDCAEILHPGYADGLDIEIRPVKHGSWEAWQRVSPILEQRLAEREARNG